MTGLEGRGAGGGGGAVKSRKNVRIGKEQKLESGFSVVSFYKYSI